jgi:hypothetical protein
MRGAAAIAVAAAPVTRSLRLVGSIISVLLRARFNVVGISREIIVQHRQVTRAE